MKKIRVGFIGAGGIAKAHVYAIQALKYYYNNVPKIILESVTSARKESRESFAGKFNFNKAQTIDDFVKNPNIDAVFILGPNNVHFQHFELALKMPNTKYIYLEKPVCATKTEEEKMKSLLAESTSEVKIQVGFQYLQTSAVREGLRFWRSGVLGKPIHFGVKYYHGDYLQKSYRDKRQNRLTPAPDGGAMADLGSHGISLLMAFLGTDIEISSALQAGYFDDVPNDSDLFSSISLVHKTSGSVGVLSASRISSGSGDLVEIEIFAENGAFKYSSLNPGIFEYYIEGKNEWVKKVVASNYNPDSSFPSKHVPPGWLRSMVHAHYQFFVGNDNYSALADLNHGLEVQRIVRETAAFLKHFRKQFRNDQ